MLEIPVCPYLFVGWNLFEIHIHNLKSSIFFLLSYLCVLLRYLAHSDDPGTNKENYDIEKKNSPSNPVLYLSYVLSTSSLYGNRAMLKRFVAREIV